jgi:alkaline phosphatase
VVFALTSCASGVAPGSPDANSVGDEPDGRAADSDAGITSDAKRVVVLVVGDGMGFGQLEAASRFAHGAPGALGVYSLPNRGEIRSASLSGITDSAAAATTMATGAATFNGRIGQDRAGAPRETLVELAHRLGMPAGVVSTAALAHATPGAFTAHRPSRDEYVDIADDQVLVVQPEVMLGGGAMYYDAAGTNASVRDDDGLVDAASAAGYTVARNAGQLQAAADESVRVLGLFADEHMDYELDRTADSEQPSLTDMSLAALDVLDRTSDEGFFLLIEGARIDMAGHGNDIERAIGETIELDRTVEAVRAWAAARPIDMTLIVTADHETGGLHVVEPAGMGEVPEVTWRWDQHTNARIGVFASGPGTELFDGVVSDFRSVHAVLSSSLTSAAIVQPPALIVPDGHLGDLRHRAVEQTVVSGFGEGFNQLDALYVDADEHGLAIGVEGLFQWDENAVVIALDVDYGAETGAGDLSGAVNDTEGRADAILASLNVVAPPVDGFGAELAVVVWGGVDPHLEDMHEDAGLRGIISPLGDPSDLWWYGAATNFGERVRVRGDAATPVSGDGLEVVIPWDTLYPDGVPAGATVALAAMMVNDDGGYTSNQALPPFTSGIDNPGRDLVPLPGIVVFVADSDADGVPDGDEAPTILP